jgi:hypothetical protein
MLASMAKTTTGERKTGGRRAGMKPKVSPARADGRLKSKLTMAREEASRLAGRTLLLATCEALKWNLTRVAETLAMATPSDVIRALKELAPEEYDAARERGDVSTRRDS